MVNVAVIGINLITFPLNNVYDIIYVPLEVVINIPDEYPSV